MKDMGCSLHWVKTTPTA